MPQEIHEEVESRMDTKAAPLDSLTAPAVPGSSQQTMATRADVVASMKDVRELNLIFAKAVDLAVAHLMQRAPNIKQRLWPYAPLPPQLQEKVDAWLTANRSDGADVYHGVFPLGMVSTWIERAERAEKKVAATRAATE